MRTGCCPARSRGRGRGRPVGLLGSVGLVGLLGLLGSAGFSRLVGARNARVALGVRLVGARNARVALGLGLVGPWGRTSWRLAGVLCHSGFSGAFAVIIPASAPLNAGV